MKKIENKFMTVENLERAIEVGDEKIGEYIARLARRSLGANQQLELTQRIAFRDFLEAQLEMRKNDVPKPAPKKKAEPKDEE